MMTKIDRAHKSYHTPEICDEPRLREIFYSVDNLFKHVLASTNKTDNVLVVIVRDHIANQTIIKPINSVQNSVCIVATTVIVLDLANYRV